MKRSENTEDAPRQTLSSWLARGLLAGAVLGAAEVLGALVGGEFLLARPLLFFLVADTILGAGIGLGIWGLRRVVGRGGEPDWAGSLVPLATGMSLLYLVNRAVVATSFRGIAPGLGLLILGVGLGVGALVGLRLLRALTRAPATPGALALSLALVGAWLVGGRTLTKSLFGAYFSTGGLVANVVLVVLLVGLLVFQARLLGSRVNRSTRVRSPTPTLLLVLLVPVLTVTVHDMLRRAQEPSTVGRDGASQGRISPERGAPDIILVTLDTLRADQMIDPASGEILLPSLRALADRATIYTHAVSPSSWTLPSHASIFTGLLPDAHGAANLPEGKSTEPFQPGSPRPLASRYGTIAEHLREDGYTTVGVVANHGMLDRRLGVAQGFDHYDDRPRLSWSQRPFLHDWLWKVQPLWYLRLTRTYRPADLLADNLSEALAGTPGRRPLFLFINLVDPHFPYAPPQRYTQEVARNLGPLVEPREQIMRTSRAPTDDEYDYFTTLYDGEVAFLDRHLDQVLERLRRKDLLDGALVVIAADHGEAFGEHGLWAHGYGPYEEVHHVPLMVSYSDQEPTGIEEQTVSLVDLFDLMVSTAASEGDAPPLRVRTAGEEPALIQQFVSADDVSAFGARVARPYCGAVRFPWKLVEYGDGEMELYDLRRKDAETHDLSESRPDLAEQLGRATTECLRQMVATYEIDDAGGSLTPETRRRLRGLGYLN